MIRAKILRRVRNKGENTNQTKSLYLLVKQNKNVCSNVQVPACKSVSHPVRITFGQKRCSIQLDEGHKGARDSVGQTDGRMSPHTRDLIPALTAQREFERQYEGRHRSGSADPH